MSGNIDEQISALVDGEQSANEQDLLIRRLLKDPELQQRWLAMHAVRDALAGRLTGSGGELSAKVMAALDDEPELEAPVAVVRPVLGVRRAAVGFSIAATVTVVALLGVTQESAQQVDPALDAAAPVADVSPVGAPPEDPDQALRARMDTYATRHDDQATATVPASDAAEDAEATEDAETPADAAEGEAADDGTLEGDPQP